jgi:hypothetical protein
MPPNVVSQARGKSGSKKQSSGGGASSMRWLWELV